MFHQRRRTHRLCTNQHTHTWSKHLADGKFCFSSSYLRHCLLLQAIAALQQSTMVFSEFQSEAVASQNLSTGPLYITLDPTDPPAQFPVCS